MTADIVKFPKVSKGTFDRQVFMVDLVTLLLNHFPAEEIIAALEAEKAKRAKR
jgi:hypothetical protein